MLEGILEIPVNPGRYIPHTPYTSKLIDNIALDLSVEKEVLGQGDYCLEDTRASLLSSGLLSTHPAQFAKDYQKALAYEKELAKALRAKEHSKLKIYKEEISLLWQEVGLLEQAKVKPGLTVGDVAQLELAIEAKKKTIRELNEQISQGLQAGLCLSADQQATLSSYQVQQDLAIMEQYRQADQQRIKAKYRSWW